MWLLSHYTSRSGLEGIAKSRALWATNFLDLKDSSEFFYAWLILQRDAINAVMKQIPDELKAPSYSVDDGAVRATTKFREHMRNDPQGYGHLYVTSFARGRTEDQDRRGILSLWRHYTNNKGYCLQFDQSAIEHMLQLDRLKATYETAGLHEVRYGVDRDDWEYKQMLFQFSQMLLLGIAQERGDRRIILPDYEKLWAPSAVPRKAVEFCAVHKDPCFADEREIRLFLYPSNETVARVFTGIASPKKIRRKPTGERYIVVGDHWRPGISPVRIIIGPKADPDIRHIVRMFDPEPSVVFCDMPEG